MLLYNEKLVNEKEISINVEDRGYQFGDGVYEVIRFYNGQGYMINEHLNRLQRSADEIRMEWPCTRECLVSNINALIKDSTLTDGIIYLQMTRGNAPRNHLFPLDAKSVLTGYARALARPLKIMEDGIKAKLLDDIRWLRCDIKSLNLLGNVLLKQEASEAGFQEAILHRDGTITEGSSTNVFLVKDGKLMTHPATHLILNGMTRQKIMELASSLEIEVIEHPFTIDALTDADEVFISSTTMEIVPVIQIDGMKIAHFARGEITEKLQNAFQESIELLSV